MLFALALLAASADAYPTPLTPAASGQMQCYVPSDHKTCASIATYTANGDGTFANGAQILLSKQPVVVMQTTTPVTIKAGAVCGAVTKASIANAGLTVNGQAVPADKAAPVLQQIAGSLGSVIDHEICTTYVPDGTGFVAKASMDGKPQPAQDQKVIWVSPSDGYTVAP
jgi:hypothetical protein